MQDKAKKHRENYYCLFSSRGILIREYISEGNYSVEVEMFFPTVFKLPETR